MPAGTVTTPPPFMAVSCSPAFELELPNLIEKEEDQQRRRPSPPRQVRNVSKQSPPSSLRSNAGACRLRHGEATPPQGCCKTRPENPGSQPEGSFPREGFPREGFPTKRFGVVVVGGESQGGCPAADGASEARAPVGVGTFPQPV